MNLCGVYRGILKVRRVNHCVSAGVGFIGGVCGDLGGEIDVDGDGGAVGGVCMFSSKTSRNLIARSSAYEGPIFVLGMKSFYQTNRVKLA